MDDKGFVYEFYDNESCRGNPIYVGKTKNIISRMHGHFNGIPQGQLTNEQYKNVRAIKYADCGTYGNAGIIEQNRCAIPYF